METRGSGMIVIVSSLPVSVQTLAFQWQNWPIASAVQEQMVTGTSVVLATKRASSCNSHPS